jgi:hypothetical protein
MTISWNPECDTPVPFLVRSPISRTLVGGAAGTLPISNNPETATVRS